MNKNKVGLGTFPLTGVFNAISEKEAENIIKKFISEGGYYIDTAPLYGNGQVEKLLGKALKGIPRDSFYLITKTIKLVDDNGSLYKSGKYEKVIKGLNESLTRLNLDYVDNLMIHQPDPAVPAEETIGAMEDLQKAGKVKDLSVSNVNLEELKEYNKTGKIKYVQNRFSLISRSLSPDFQKYLLDNKIFLMPYHLLEIGFLTDNALDPDFNLRPEDFRNKLPYWNTENQSVIFEWVRNYLAPIAKNLGITIGQLNIAWALHQKYIDFIIAGTTKPEYLKINLKANDIKLSQKDLQDLEEAYKVLEQGVKEKYGKTLREFRGLNEKYY